MVQARGIAKVHQDSEWLAAQVSSLTDKHEAKQPAPWSIEDAPESYITSQLRGIVGVEIQIETLEGKWKVSQNRPAEDRRGVADGLKNENPTMAALVRRYGGIET